MDMTTHLAFIEVRSMPLKAALICNFLNQFEISQIIGVQVNLFI